MEEYTPQPTTEDTLRQALAAEARSNGSKPAFRSVSGPHLCDGLTKREAFAMAAMQGRLAGETGEAPTESYQETAIVAVRMADALLAELAKVAS